MDPRELIEKKIYQFAESDPLFTVFCADVAVRIGLDNFRKEYPDNFVEAGIAEQNMIGMASAMANEGFHVMAVAYAPFLTARVMDQIKVFLGYMKSPVVLLGIGAGLVSGDLGATHTALEDIAMMRCIPNITIMAPSDCCQLEYCLDEAMKKSAPCYIRVSSNHLLPLYESPSPFSNKKSICLKQGKDICILSAGAMVHDALKTSDLLAQKNISCAVYDCFTLKPIDHALLDSCTGYRLLVAIEDHNIIGGFGSSIAEYISQKRGFPPLLKIGVQDRYFHADTYSSLKDYAGLTPNKMAEQIKTSLKMLDTEEIL